MGAVGANRARAGPTYGGILSLRRLRTAAVWGSVGVAAVALVLAQTAPASAAGQTKYVVAADIGTSRAAPGATAWFADVTNAGAYATTTTAFDGSQSLQLSTPAATDGIRVLNSYGVGATTLTIPQIVAGASYTYSGTNVNFQIDLLHADGPGLRA